MKSVARSGADHFGAASQFVGLPTVRHYTDHTTAPLVIGKDRLSYVEIAQRTGLPAGRAARIVTELAIAHRAVSIRDFYKNSSPGSVAVEHFGECGFLMLLKVFESEGLDIVQWCRRGPLWQQDGKDNFSTFTTYKRRDARATANTRTAQRKQRKRGMAAPAMDKEGAIYEGPRTVDK